MADGKIKNVHEIFQKKVLIPISCVVIFSCNNPYQIAKIKYNVNGCFYSEQSEMSIYKLGNRTVAEFASKNKKTLRTELNAAQIDSFNSFIKKLKQIKEGGYCTTEESFIAYFNNEIITKVIDNCSWNGFQNLKRYFFKNQK